MKSMSRTLLAVALLSAFGVGAANAATSVSFIKSGANAASDENREYLIDNSYAVDGVKGRIDVGDSLRGLINFNTINSPSANLGGATPNDELTGVFQAKIAVKTGPILGQYVFNFAPDPAFEAIYGPGALIALFNDPLKNFASDYTDPTAPGGLVHDDGALHGGVHLPPSSADVSVGPYADEEAFISTATNGSLVWVLGFKGAAGEAWETSLSTDSILAAFGIVSGTNLTTANFAVNVLSTGAIASGITILPQSCGLVLPVSGVALAGDFCGSIQIRGVSDLDTPFEASSNTNVSFNAKVIPEPATLGLLGLGLLGMGAALRRKA